MDTAINEAIQRCEIITHAANRLTEYRLSDNPSLDEMISEIPYAVMSAMEIKGVLPDTNYLLKNELIEHFEEMLIKYNS